MIFLVSNIFPFPCFLGCKSLKFSKCSAHLKTILRRICFLFFFVWRFCFKLCGGTCLCYIYFLVIYIYILIRCLHIMFLWQSVCVWMRLVCSFWQTCCLLSKIIPMFQRSTTQCNFTRHYYFCLKLWRGWSVWSVLCFGCASVFGLWVDDKMPDIFVWFCL